MSTVSTGSTTSRSRTQRQPSPPTSWRPATDRGPSPATHRRPALIALALLLIVGGAAVAGLLAIRMDARTDVLVAARPIAVGAQISSADLATTRVASEGLALIPAAQASQVIGRYAGQTIPTGRLLDVGMVKGQGFLQPGKAAVGVSLAVGHMPASGLRQGDVVQVIHVHNGASTVLSAKAVVSYVPAGTSSSSIIGGSSDAPAAATLIVNEADAPKVAAASVANEVALVLLTRGGEIGAG